MNTKFLAGHGSACLEAGGSLEFEDSLVYEESSRTAGRVT